LTQGQRDKVHDTTGLLFGGSTPGGITKRNQLSRIAKGADGTASNKPEYIRAMVERFTKAGKSVIVWCLYNNEQDTLAAMMPDAANIDGSTPADKREELVNDFKAGRRKVLMSKGKILGFGLNLQIATVHIFSGLQDSYETYYQCVKRSNRYGSTVPLEVYIPITELEEPMIQTVLEKAKRVHSDTVAQESIFMEARKEMENAAL
jgi:superfamily II DNA or RNA helicase